MTAISSTRPQPQSEMQLAAAGAARYTIITVVSIAATALSILTLGRNKKINEAASALEKSFKVLSRPYWRLMNAAGCECRKPSRGSKLVEISNNIFSAPMEKAMPNKNWFVQHVVCRFLYATAGLTTAVAGVADLALGLLATVFSAVTLGRFEKVNNFAATQLQGTGALLFIGLGLRGLVNPQQFMRNS